ncbi:MAG: alkaline phosphatase [Actinomycetota bacterium]|jgi:alkaline phosphatase D
MGNHISRRRFVVGAAGAGVAAATWRYAPNADGADPLLFAHGVGSFDPLADRVILWTRVVTTQPVSWQIARDPSFTSVLRGGIATTSAASDYTVHVDVDGLAPATTYWYRFVANGVTSPTGRTRTLPAPGAVIDRLRIGVVTCAEWEFGFFGAYRVLAERNDIDVVLALGDYIYEFAQSYGGLPSPKPGGRAHDPAHEIETLDDYRIRHRQYRTDAGLQQLHASHPVIAIYDDHEVCNDWWRDGAQAHDPATEGDFHVRREAGLRAFREWVPIRADVVDPAKTYRRFQFGNLLDLFMIDGRLYRDEQPTSAVVGYISIDPSAEDPNKTLLGATQREWLLNGLKQSAAAWKVLGNPVAMMPIDVGPPLAGLLSSAAIALGGPGVPPPLLVEGWDGYNAERTNILNYINTNTIKDVVVLTGDYHESFASQLPFDRANYQLAENSAGVEFIAPAITSPNLSETLQMGNLPQALTINTVFEANLAVSNPWVKYHEGFANGFGVAEFRPDGMQFDFWFIDARTADTAARAGASWTVPRGSSVLAQAAGPLGPRPAVNAGAPQPVATIPATGGTQSTALVVGAAAVAAVAAAQATKKSGEIPE